MCLDDIGDHSVTHDNWCNFQFYSLTSSTVFTRLNAAAFVKFSNFLMWRLLEGGVYFKNTFLKSLTTSCKESYVKVPNLSLILLRYKS